MPPAYQTISGLFISLRDAKQLVANPNGSYTSLMKQTTQNLQLPVTWKTLLFVMTALWTAILLWYVFR